MAAAQAALEEKYRSYEEMAGWSAVALPSGRAAQQRHRGAGGRARRR